MSDLATLRSLVRVVETGSFSEAARRLGLSKSMVSRQISALEAELGVRLLQRTTRSLTPTEAGRAYFERCRRILADLDDANLLVSQLQAEPRGQLRISAPMSFGIQHLSPVLPAFLDRYPEVALSMTMSDRYVDLVEEGYDVAVRIGRLSDSSLVARRLAPNRRMVCASPAYLARNGTPLQPDDLKNHCCLSHSDLESVEWRFVGPHQRAIAVNVSGRFRANNGDAIRAMALAGTGIAYLPTFFVGEDVRQGRLVSLLEDFVPLDSALYAVYPHGRLLSPKVRSFIDFLAETFGPEPYWDAAVPA